MAHAKPRLFRDPIHDIIALEPGTPEGRLSLALIDCKEMQRLRRIRQLALSHFVYHGAEHSRFAHSMGVAHLTRRMLNQIAVSVPVSDEDRMVAVAAALLHDVGHGPFSHAIESVTGVRHERRTEGIILSPDSEVHRALAAVDPALPKRVATLACGGDDGGPPYLRELVSSQLDADRMDYILRDGHMTGVKIGSFDLGRIIAMTDVADGHLALHAGAQEAIEGYLLARFHMYKQVYLHKTSRAAERMLEAALGRAAALATDGRPPAYWPKGGLADLLTGKPVSHEDFVALDDVDVWLAMKHWARDTQDRVLQDLADGLVNRRLYKTLALPADKPARATEMVESARAIARVKGFDPDFHVLVDQTLDSPYRPFTGMEGSGKSIRLIVPTPGEPETLQTVFLEDRSQIVELLGRLQHHRHFLCVHPDLRPALLRLAA